MLRKVCLIHALLLVELFTLLKGCIMYMYSVSRKHKQKICSGAKFYKYRTWTWTDAKEKWFNLIYEVKLFKYSLRIFFWQILPATNSSKYFLNQRITKMTFIPQFQGLSILFWHFNIILTFQYYFDISILFWHPLSMVLRW